MLLDRIDPHKCSRVLRATLCVTFALPAFAQSETTVREHITAALYVCERAPENGGTFQQATCYGDEDARQDRILNNTWRKLIVRLPAPRRAELREKERRWITMRDAECHNEAADYINSTAALMYGVCFAEATIRRTIWLKHLR